MFTERTKTKGEHVVLGVAVRADFSAQRHSQNQGKKFLCQVRAGISAEWHTHPHPFSGHAVSCSTELVVGQGVHADAKWAE